MSIFNIDCGEPAPYITGNWRPNTCNAIPTLIVAIEAITTYLCEEVIPGQANNNFRVVPEDTSDLLFNTYFDGGLPATDSIVAEGDDIWVTADAGVTWEPVHTRSFQVGVIGDFVDPFNPLAAEINVLFGSEGPMEQALAYLNETGYYYYTIDTGGVWTKIEANGFRSADAGDFIDPVNPLDAELNAVFSPHPNTFALVYITSTGRFWYTNNQGATWTAAFDFVKVTGDDMTGRLTITVDETDLAGSYDALNVSATHRLTGDNTEEMSGIIVTSFLDADAFDSVGIFGIGIEITHDGEAGSVVDDLIGIRADINKSGAASVVTRATAIQAQGITNTSTGTITDVYGIRVENQTAGINNYSILTNTGLVVFNEGGNASSDVRIEGDTDTSLFFTDASANSVGMGTNTPTGKLHVQQENVGGGIPVINLQQKDISEEFIRFVGESDGTNTASIVEAADFPTPGAIAGWARIFVQDDTVGGLADGYYVLPIYALPT